MDQRGGGGGWTTDGIIHEKPTPRARTSEKDQGGKTAGPMDWSTRGVCGRGPGLENQGTTASNPGLGHPGLNRKGEPTVMITKSPVEARTGPQ